MEEGDSDEETGTSGEEGVSDEESSVCGEKRSEADSGQPQDSQREDYRNEPSPSGQPTAPVRSPQHGESGQEPIPGSLYDASGSGGP